MTGDYGEPNTINQLPNPKWERPELEPRRGLVLFPWWVWPLVILGVVVIVGGTWIAVIRPGSTKKPPVVIATATATRGAASFATATKVSTGLPPVPSTPVPTVPMPTGAATAIATTAVVPTSAQPSVLAVGAKVVVKGTGTDGLNIRASASKTAKALVIAKEGSVLTILEGPQAADGLSWWKVQDASGTTGWAAGTYLTVQ